MQDIQYINLSNDQRDQLLSQSLDERVELFRNAVAENSLKLGDDTEEVLASQVRFGLEFVEDKLDGKAGDRIEIAMLLDSDAFFGDYSDNGALVELIEMYKSKCPHRVLQSVSWAIKSTDKRDALSRSIRDFVIEAVLPNRVGNICDAEIGIWPISTSMHGFDAFNLKVTQSVIDQVGATYNG